MIFLDYSPKELELEKIGPSFENHKRFPDRINTEFVHVLNRNTVEMRVWERGSGETMACGTGACAVAVASILNGFTEDEVTVTTSGRRSEDLLGQKREPGLYDRTGDHRF